MTMHNPPHPGAFIREVYLARTPSVAGRLPSSWALPPQRLAVC